MTYSLDLNLPLQTQGGEPALLLKENMIPIKGEYCHLIQVGQKYAIIDNEGYCLSTGGELVKNVPVFKVGKIYRSNTGDKYVVIQIDKDYMRAAKLNSNLVVRFKTNGVHHIDPILWLEKSPCPNT